MSGAIAGAVLLVAAVTALGAAALRVASLATTDGLERAVAAAPLFVACAVVEALALGTVGLGGSGIALALAALLTSIAVWHLVPSRSAEPIPRIALIGLTALWAGWVVWALRFPYLGLDGSTYHLSAAAEWVHQGTTGHSLDLYARIPVGSYPLTGETALAWAVGLAHSFAPVALWTASVVVLLVAAAWVGLRCARGAALARRACDRCLVRRAGRAARAGALGDRSAVAWLVTAGALAACARARPALLAPAVVAAWLAIGTKTTTLPLAVLVVALGAYAVRSSLRRLALPLGLALGLGFAAGGLWYLRNLVAHGSPLWPFVSAPWGDPVPPLLDRVNYSLLERPRATLEGQWAIYRVTLSGGLVLLAGGLLAPLWARRREVIAAAAVTLFAVLTWAAAPFTGAGAAPFLQVNTLRYLVPAMAAGALALALSGRCAVPILLASIAWSAKTYLDNPYLPGEGTLIVVAVATAVIVLFTRTRALPVIAAVGMAAALILGGEDYVQRHGQAGDFDSGVVTWFTQQPAWRDGHQPIAFSPTPIAPLAGDRLHHPLELVGPDEPCAQVTARLTRGWVVVRKVDRNLFGTLAAERCLAPLKPVYDDGIHRVYQEAP